MGGTRAPRAAKARGRPRVPGSPPARCATVGRQVNLVESPSPHPSLKMLLFTSLDSGEVRGTSTSGV